MFISFGEILRMAAGKSAGPTKWICEEAQAQLFYCVGKVAFASHLINKASIWPSNHKTTPCSSECRWYCLCLTPSQSFVCGLCKVAPDNPAHGTGELGRLQPARGLKVPPPSLPTSQALKSFAFSRVSCAAHSLRAIELWMGTKHIAEFAQHAPAFPATLPLPLDLALVPGWSCPALHEVYTYIERYFQLDFLFPVSNHICPVQRYFCSPGSADDL